MSHRPWFIAALALLATAPVVSGQERGTPETYRTPPAEVARMVEAPPPPLAVPSPDGRRLALVESPALPPIALLAEPFLRLGGVRVTPRTNDRQRLSFNTAISIRGLADDTLERVQFPDGARLGFPVWSGDGARLAVTVSTDAGVELWIADATSGKSRRVVGPRLNGVLGSSFGWMPDAKTIACRLVPQGRGPEPKAPTVPSGPRIEESAGKVSKLRTYQDLLENAHDEALFTHYATSVLGLVGVDDGKLREVGRAGLIASIDPSPSGARLLVTVLHPPFSRAVPFSDFPRTIEVWDLDGKPLRTVADLPVSDQVPIEGVPTGPRAVEWKPLDPATLVWAEALDGGDPERKIPHRDRLVLHADPFEGEPHEFARLEHRYRGLEWLETKGLAFVTEYDRDRKWRRTTLLSADDATAPRRVVWDLSVNDRYADPGRPIVRTNARGESMVRVEGNAIYLAGPGASPEGDRPFLDRMALEDLKTERLFRSEAEAYESFVAFVGDGTKAAVTRRESAKEPPNHFALDLATGSRRALTDYRDPAPALTQGLRKKLLRYERADGIPLSGMLYLPPGHREGERLPLVVWAYPLEFTDRATAGQVRGTPNRFTFFRGISQLFFLTQGYAVLDDAQIPIVGDPKTVNDTYKEQLVASAKAAIDAAVAEGVADSARVGVGGHSYGAFMTANLLAHCDLFRAGIARSGAYNRTLTPFGFQSERRTLWEAPQTYWTMSPFMHADRIDEPILLVHGEVDSNPGTFPMQSERLFHALKGHGAIARLVVLPHESHGYQARESVLHTLAEMFDWFDRWVKAAPPRAQAADASGKAKAGG